MSTQFLFCAEDLTQFIKCVVFNAIIKSPVVIFSDHYYLFFHLLPSGILSGQSIRSHPVVYLLVFSHFNALTDIAELRT